MEFFYLIKATQKSGKPSAVVWFSAKTEARAKLQVQVILEDNEIATGRGHDYQLPVLTNFPVVDDLPAEEVIDFTWCDRYALTDDGRTWQKITSQATRDTQDTESTEGAVNEAADPVSSPAETSPVQTNTHSDVTEDDDENTLYPVVKLRLPQRIIAQYLSDKMRHHVTQSQRIEIGAMEMDSDNSHVQNLLLAARNIPGIDNLTTHELWKLTSAFKSVFPEEKRHELAVMVQFIQAWSDTHHIDRGLLVKEWAAGKRIAAIQRTDTGANAGGGIATDRNPDYEHTLDTLDIEIAAATMPMDFDIYNIPGSVHRRAKDIVAAKESPFKEWSAALRKTPGILDFSRAAIFALIRSATENVHHFPVSLQTYINANLTEHQHDKPTAETIAAARQIDSAAIVAGVIQGTEPAESLDKLATEFAVVGKAAAEAAHASVNETTGQPEVKKLGGGMFSIDGLIGDTTQTSVQENADDVQMEETFQIEDQNTAALPGGESVDLAGTQADTLSTHDIMAAAASLMAAAVAEQENIQPLPEDVQLDATDTASEPEYPAFFEPGRYEGLPNNVYHAANGISSTQVKDARVSLMYFNARHVAKTIAREQSKVLDMGNLVHALALQPENLLAEFSIEPEIPKGAFTTTATIRAFIDEYNAGLPPQLSTDDIKALLETHNTTLPAQLPLGTSVDETGQSYMSLPAEYQRIEEGQKQTATAMKACIKEYNSTLPAPVKTSGSRDALLEQLALVNPDLVAQEAQKPAPLKVSGTKADLIQAVKSVNPDAVFADELLDAWRENPEDKILVTRQQMATATAIQSALLAHPTAGKFLTHPGRAVEVSYFGFDDETGLEIRVRPDLEIDMGGIRVGVDLKTISMWNVKQPALRAKLHREIIDRDYHLSAAMYMNTAALDQFFWIFVNKDEGYHWIAIVEASPELIELGALEYQTTIRAIANAFDTGEWPAPVTEDYADELNDYDLRRLEALRALANA
ncbi:RecE family exodeoxyribonuclease [Kosakonia oryzae]|uniref:Exodeoxyribonuclease VIII n=1 Tax=Kosakonia oryzae TaxID=497725 RepID=A0AA94KP53_9ENTR|nr:RecE family exodeoxyribonuclease [Kosakonia oryzae]ANI83325.1 PD-(D/E)XK nuclease-like domain-containing protein [Kosakonia oryzae]SFC02326.1 exodeoxyribonuclease VIII [Kosakonia oryzae]